MRSSNSPPGTDLYAFFERVPNEEKAEQFFAEWRWGKDMVNRVCPHCASSRTVTAYKNTMPYRCKDCRKRFSVRTGTILEMSRIPLKKWLLAIYMLHTNRKGVASIKLAKDLGITQKTAWFLAHRIRKAFEDQREKKFETDKVEIDETYIGGKIGNMHKRKRPRMSSAGPQDKIPIVGIRDRRTGHMKAQVTYPVSAMTLHKFVQESVSEGAMLYTDQHRGYINLVKKGYEHKVVHHGKGQYVDGDAHTNGVESFWALVKRGFKGTYHKHTKKHMQRYVDEYVGRHNMTELGTMGQIVQTLEGLDGKHLSYEELTKEVEIFPFPGGTRISRRQSA